MAEAHREVHVKANEIAESWVVADTNELLCDLVEFFGHARAHVRVFDAVEGTEVTNSSVLPTDTSRERPWILHVMPRNAVVHQTWSLNGQTIMACQLSVKDLNWNGPKPHSMVEQLRWHANRPALACNLVTTRFPFTAMLTGEDSPLVATTQPLEALVAGNHPMLNTVLVPCWWLLP